MGINITVPESETPELKPRITVVGVGGAGGNAVNNMIESQLEGVDFVVANTDAQALQQSRTDRRIQLGEGLTQGLGAGARSEVGQAAAEEAMDDIVSQLKGANMAFIAAGMGGGTGTGAAPVVARAAKEQGILTVGVITKPFHFEGPQRMRIAEAGIEELEKYVDTLIIIPNQNLFRVANEKTTFADAFKMADDVLYSGVRGVTDLMVMPGLINLDFADVRSVMNEMGKAMMGTGEAEGERRALDAAEAAISNPLLDDTSMKGAKGVLINITGGGDMTLFEVDEAANRIRAEVDQDAYIIFGSTFDEGLQGRIRVSVVATGIDAAEQTEGPSTVLDMMARPNATRPAPKPSFAADEEAETPQPAVAEAAEAGATTDEAVAREAAEADSAPAAETPAIAAALDPQGPAATAPQAEAEAGAEAETTAAETGPAGMPRAGATDAFIPPQAVERTSAPARPAHADPFAEADMANAPKQKAEPADKPARRQASVKERGLSLFERVTGAAGRGKPDDDTVKPFQPAESAHKAEPDKDSEKGHLGGMKDDDRASPPRNEEDLLDIPAFLRRQAN